MGRTLAMVQAAPVTRAVGDGRVRALEEVDETIKDIRVAAFRAP